MWVGVVRLPYAEEKDGFRPSKWLTEFQYKKSWSGLSYFHLTKKIIPYDMNLPTKNIKNFGSELVDYQLNRKRTLLTNIYPNNIKN